MSRSPQNLGGITSAIISDDGRRVNVSTSTVQELQIANGEFFTGSIDRSAIPSGDTFYSILKAPNDKFVVIEQSIIDVNYQDALTGTMNVIINAYIDKSSGSDWTASGGVSSSAGRPLNANKINEVSSATITAGVAVNLTGIEDYKIYFSNYFRESQGNVESISGTGSSFFDQNNQIILGPGQELLLETSTTGTSDGTIDISSIFFISEIAATGSDIVEPT